MNIIHSPEYMDVLVNDCRSINSGTTCKHDVYMYVTLSVTKSVQ